RRVQAGALSTRVPWRGRSRSAGPNRRPARATQHGGRRQRSEAAARTRDRGFRAKHSGEAEAGSELGEEQAKRARRQEDALLRRSVERRLGKGRAAWPSCGAMSAELHTATKPPTTP